jgi:hypothetical protein
VDVTIDDDQLAAEALAADPEAVVPPDAVPLSILTGDPDRQALPSWYMPAPMAAPRVRGWRRVLLRVNVALIISAFLTITAAGLCNTYGDLHL